MSSAPGDPCGVAPAGAEELAPRPTWACAVAALAGLSAAERGALLLLARLPLAPARTLVPLLAPRRAVDAALDRLREAGLVDAFLPRPLRGRRPERLWYPTDLGLGAVALDRRVEPRSLADRLHLRRAQLGARLSHASAHLAAYELLAALAAACPEQPTLLGWEQPWFRRVRVPRRRLPVAVGLPRHVPQVLLGVGERRVNALLLPDDPAVRHASYRAALTRLAALAGGPQPPPPVLVAAADGGRAEAWRDLVRELDEGGARVAVVVATWPVLASGAWALPDVLVGGRAAEPRQPRLVRLGGRAAAGRVLPRLVGWAPLCAGADPCPAELSPDERRLLHVVAAQPFHAERLLPEVADLPGWRCRAALAGLRARSLLRTPGADEVGPAAGCVLVEATAAGLAVAALDLGPSPARARREHGLVGGGPDAPTGDRNRLVARLGHTLAVNAFLVALHRALRRRRARGRAAALTEWRNEAACADGALRPDGRGTLCADGQRHEFFLEIDRGSATTTDLRRKFASYAAHRDRGRPGRAGGPVVLFVAAGAQGELRALRALRALGRGGAPPAARLTTLRRLRADPEGPLGAVWRELGTPHLRRWPA